MKRAGQLFSASSVALLTIFAVVGLPDIAGAAAVPTAPRAVTATAAGNGAETVSWKAPLNGGGSPILGYTVTPYIGVFAETPVQFKGKQTTQTVSGLQNGTAYQFSVTANNAVGAGAASLRSAKTIVGVPRKPKAPSGTWRPHASELQVIFLAPPNGGAPITSYTAKCSPQKGGKAFAHTGPPEKYVHHLVLYVDGVVAGTRYNCRVKATNSRGSSDWSGGGPFRVA